jgi:hypothetical protein
MEFDELSRTVIGCASEVHRTLGPGLSNPLIASVLRVSCRTPKSRFKWRFRFQFVRKTFRWIADIESICLSAALLPIHRAQLLTYMRLARIPIGLLINFNMTKLQSGIKRFVL